jgi:hypothetical protein
MNVKLSQNPEFEKRAGQSAPPVQRHIDDVVAERMSKVPSEIMATMPEDGASQHNHYIYGHPKSEE